MKKILICLVVLLGGKVWAAQVVETCFVSTDDCRRYASSITLTSPSHYHGGGGTDFHHGYRFLTIPITGPVTVDSAYIGFQPIAGDYPADTANGVCTLYLMCEAADDPITFSTVGDYDARPRTDSVRWSNIAKWYSGDPYKYSIDIKAQVQAVLDRGGWASGNDIVVFVNDSIGSAVYRRGGTADDIGPAILRINYHAGGGGGGGGTGIRILIQNSPVKASQAYVE